MNSYLIKLVLLSACLFIAAVAIAGNRTTMLEQLKSESVVFQELFGAEAYKKSLRHAEKIYELSLRLFGTENRNTRVALDNYQLNLTELSKYKDASDRLILTGIRQHKSDPDRLMFTARGKPKDKSNRKYKLNADNALKVLRVNERVYGKNAKELIPILTDISYGLVKWAVPFEQANLIYFSRAIRIAKKHHGETSLEYARLSVKIGDFLLHEGRAEAGRYLHKGFEILEAELGNEHRETALLAFNIGKFELGRNRNKKAKHYFLKSLEIADGLETDSNEIALSAHGFLVKVYENLGESENATQHCLAIGNMTPAKPTQDMQPVYKAVPEYPKVAIRDRVSGSALVEFDVDESGFVRNPKVIELDGVEQFGFAAIAAVKKFRYAPKFKDGEAAYTKGVRNKITFVYKKRTRPKKFRRVNQANLP